MEKIFDKSVNIVFAADNNYAPCTIVALYSLIAHTTKENNYKITPEQLENAKLQINLVFSCMTQQLIEVFLALTRAR